MSAPPSSGMQLFDRIELRRFVGREFLLWLWFESEILDATLATKEHGSFGLWLEGRLVLSAGKESTAIKGSSPGNHREAKEALLRGKLPERAGLHLSYGDHDATLTLKADTLAVAGLKLPTVLGGEGGKGDDPHETFYERARLTREIEEILEALYRDFLALRLGDAWDAAVMPALGAWARGDDVDVDGYRSARGRAAGARRQRAP